MLALPFGIDQHGITFMGATRDDFIKYPRTPHLFGSTGTDDDKHLDSKESEAFSADPSLIVEEMLGSRFEIQRRNRMPAWLPSPKLRKRRAPMCMTGSQERRAMLRFQL